MKLSLSATPCSTTILPDHPHFAIAASRNRQHPRRDQARASSLPLASSPPAPENGPLLVARPAQALLLVKAPGKYCQGGRCPLCSLLPALPHGQRAKASQPVRHRPCWTQRKRLNPHCPPQFSQLAPSLFGKQRPPPGAQRHARHPTPQRQSPLHPSLKATTTAQLRTRERERSHGGSLPTCVCALGRTFLGLPWSETALHSTKGSVLQPRVEGCSCGHRKAWAAGSLQPHAVGSPAAPTSLNNRASNRAGRILVSALFLRRCFLRPHDHRHHATTRSTSSSLNWMETLGVMSVLRPGTERGEGGGATAGRGQRRRDIAAGRATWRAWRNPSGFSAALDTAGAGGSRSSPARCSSERALGPMLLLVPACSSSVRGQGAARPEGPCPV